MVCKAQPLLILIIINHKIIHGQNGTLQNEDSICRNYCLGLYSSDLFFSIVYGTILKIYVSRHQKNINCLLSMCTDGFIEFVQIMWHHSYKRKFSIRNSILDINEKPVAIAARNIKPSIRAVSQPCLVTFAMF